MQARGLGVSAAAHDHGLSLAAGVPSYLAVGESSAAHYRAFTRGRAIRLPAPERRAGPPHGADVDRGPRAARSRSSDADIVGFLHGFKLPFPIATDAGAVASVRRLIGDTDAARTFVIRDDLVARLRRCVVGDIEAMPSAEQAEALRQLDARIHAADPELWRTKQVNDFLGGVWAQGYGPIYVSAIDWVFRVRFVARLICAACVATSIALLVRSRRAAAAAGCGGRAPR
jgi:hypothetical protein